MTLPACDLLVFSGKRIFRLRVIEFGLLPVGRQVALVARGQIPLVGIFLLVALEANRRGFLQLRVFMTFQTFRLLMFSHKRIFGLAVVEGRLLPILSGMARIALRP
jgi:hypothetical protein